jgi:hypothetical protein
MGPRAGAALLAVIAGVCCATALAAVRDMKLPTAEDGEIVYRVDNATKQAANAKDDRAETLPVSLAFLPRAPGGGMQWTFVYRVRFSGSAKPVSIRVETENQKPVTLEVEDRDPKVKSGIWAGRVAPIDFSKFWAEKIAAKDPWMLQRRYTITYADGRKSVLHQLSVLTTEGRAQMLETMNR